MINEMDNWQKPPTDLIAANGIDIICDRFEQAFENEEEPRIEDYLNQCEWRLRETLFEELLLVESELLAKRLSETFLSSETRILRLHQLKSPK